MSWLFYYLELTPLTSRNPQPQCIQLDKAFRILLIVRTLVFFKGRNLLVEQGLFRLPANNVYVTLVQLQANGTVHVFLSLVDQRLQGFTLRGPPVAVVHHLGIARHQAVFQVGHFAVQGDGLDGAVGTIMLRAHRAIEAITLAREVAPLEHSRMPRYAEVIYNGYWWSPEREALQALIDQTQEYVNGTVRLKLYKGNVDVVGRKSDDSLFDEKIATFEEDQGAYDQKDAEGFIKLNALRLRIAAGKGRKL